MALIQSRRRFVTNAAVAGVAGFAGRALQAPIRTNVARRRAAAGGFYTPLRHSAGLPCAPVRGRGVAARGGLYRNPLCRFDATPTQKLARNEADWALELRSVVDRRIGGEAPVTIVGGDIGPQSSRDDQIGNVARLRADWFGLGGLAVEIRRHLASPPPRMLAY